MLALHLTARARAYQENLPRVATLGPRQLV